MSWSQFRGSMVALVTPMFEDGSIDYTSLEKLVDWHISEGTNGIIAVGTTGESATLVPDEHIEVVGRCVRKARQRIPIIAGTGSNSTKEAIELSRRAKDAGADASLQVVPYYNKPPQHGLLAHFTAIADAVDLPLILYNVPSRTVADLLPHTTIKLAQHANIVGIKDATGDIARVEELRKGCGDDFVLLSGDDFSLYEFFQAGGNGVISVTANLLPRQMSQFCQVMLKGDDPAAGKKLHDQLLVVHKTLFVEPSPIPVKWALQQTGQIEGGIRLPLVPLSQYLHQQVSTILPQSTLKSTLKDADGE